MSGEGGDPKDHGGRMEVCVRLPAELALQLEEFCREKKVAADRVVERALIEYFREGDMSH